jgi:hypothetical protein
MAQTVGIPINYQFYHDHMHNTKECFALKKGDKKTNRQWLLATIYEKKKIKPEREERKFVHSIMTF